MLTRGLPSAVRSAWKPILEPISPDEAVNYYLRNRADEIAHETHGKHGDRLEQFLVWCDETDRTDMNDLTGCDLLEFEEWRAGGTESLRSRTTCGTPFAEGSRSGYVTASEDYQRIGF